MSERVTFYDAADRAIKALNRENLKIFGQLKTKLMKADELHVIWEVTNAYDSVLKLVMRWLLWVARQAYADAMKAAGKRKRNSIDHDWLLDYLEETEPIAMYKFVPELERKKARLIEALSVATDKGREIDKALRELAKQIGWFAVSVTDEATIQALEDAGIVEVVWHSEHDDRTCKTCRHMDGHIYRIEALPRKPHLGCRCWITPVITDSERETA